MEEKVKRQRLLPIMMTAVVLLAVSLACGMLNTPTSAPNPTAAPQQALPTAEPQQPQATQEQSTTAPTEAPTQATQSQQFFTEEFDNGADNWKPFVTHGNFSQLDFSTQGGKLVFDLKEKQLWTYAMYTPQTYTDVKIEVQAENFGNNENNVTLVCRYSDRGWYEVSIANSGLYQIYYGKWDANGTTASYAKIADGGSNNIQQGQATNTYALICKGNTISVFINDKEIKRIDDNQHGLRDGQIGIGVSSFRYLPVEVQFDWVKVSQP
jgi:hypothetical protein